MNTEQILIKKWRLLSTEKQQSVLDFIDFLSINYPKEKIGNTNNTVEVTGEKKSLSLEGKVTHYEGPLEPVAMEDWDVLQ